MSLELCPLQLLLQRPSWPDSSTTARPPTSVRRTVSTDTLSSDADTSLRNNGSIMPMLPPVPVSETTGKHQCHTRSLHWTGQIIHSCSASWVVSGLGAGNNRVVINLACQHWPCFPFRRDPTPADPATSTDAQGISRRDWRSPSIIGLQQRVPRWHSYHLIHTTLT